MVFEFLGDVVKGVGSIVGAVTGSIIGLSVSVVSQALGITAAMVKEATDAGCKTYEEIRDYHKL